MVQFIRNNTFIVNFLDGAANILLFPFLFFQRKQIYNVLDNDFLNDLQDKTLAIVGNGPNVYGKDLGTIIDSYDIVIRVNKGFPTDEKSKDIGMRTTIWCGGAIQKIPEEFQLETKKLIIHFPYIFKNPWRRYSSKLLNNTDYKLFFCDPEIWNELTDLLSTQTIKYPTTGFMLIYFFYKYVKFKELGIFGFTFDAFSGYENKNKKNARWHHNLEKERSYFFITIMNNKNIKYYE